VVMRLPCFPEFFIMPANKSGCQILFHRTGIAVIF
jgi:hypothetical protein